MRQLVSGFWPKTRPIWSGKCPFEREIVHGNAGKPCKYVIFEADIFPTPTVVVFPDLSCYDIASSRDEPHRGQPANTK